jgi:hypothetical protein
MHASGSQPIVNPIWAATEIDSHQLLALPLPWIGASAAIHGVLVLDFSHLSIRIVQSLSGNDWVFSQSNRSKAPSNSQ